MPDASGMSSGAPQTAPPPSHFLDPPPPPAPCLRPCANHHEVGAGAQGRTSAERASGQTKLMGGQPQDVQQRPLQGLVGARHELYEHREQAHHLRQWAAVRQAVCVGGGGGGAGNRLKGGGVPPSPPKTPALTLPQRHSHTPTPAPTAFPTASNRPPTAFTSPVTALQPLWNFPDRTPPFQAKPRGGGGSPPPHARAGDPPPAGGWPVGWPRRPNLGDSEQ